MMIDAFVGDRWRDAVRRGVEYRLPLPQLRRRHAARPPRLTTWLASLGVHTVEFETIASDGAARAGVATTANGSYTTPLFMPVGTRGAIKYLSADDYDALGAQIVLGNTYHLMLRPGAETVAALGGLAKFAGWDGLTLTDSGGFQVFSLEPKVDDDGVTFASTYDGSTHRFTPESAVATQQLLGADIQMVLDVCPPLPSPPEVVRLAVERTAAWAARAPSGPQSARSGVVRDRARWHQRNDAGRERTAYGRLGIRRVRNRWAVGGGDPPGDGAGPGGCDRSSADRAAALPDGCRRPCLAGRGRQRRGRSVRLCDADPPRTPWHGPHIDRARQSEAQRVRTERQPDRRALRLHGVSSTQPWVSPTPVQGR